MEKFWEKVEKATDDLCWLWMGAKTGNGYGAIKVDQITHLAHRFSWELHFGTIPNGKLIRHKCDVRNCVNPNHLEIGTQKDNVMDMIVRGRYVGKRLDPIGIEFVRHWLKRGHTQKSIAEAFGISRPSISRNLTRNSSFKDISI